MASIYQINKGINKPIEFKGLKGQYIAWLATGLVVLLIAFAALYISGLTLLIVMPVILGSGATLFFTVFRLSHQYGEYGLMKYFAKRRLPDYLKFRSRRLFTQLRKS
jgi:cell division protein FtsW (lipid II flippase)